MNQFGRYTHSGKLGPAMLRLQIRPRALGAIGRRRCPPDVERLSDVNLFSVRSGANRNPFWRFWRSRRLVAHHTVIACQFYHCPPKSDRHRLAGVPGAARAIRRACTAKQALAGPQTEMSAKAEINYEKAQRAQDKAFEVTPERQPMMTKSPFSSSDVRSDTHPDADLPCWDDDEAAFQRNCAARLANIIAITRAHFEIDEAKKGRKHCSRPAQATRGASHHFTRTASLP